MTSHEADREADAAFFEDWSAWKKICLPQIEQRRFLIGPLEHDQGRVLLKIPGATKVPSSYWRLEMRLSYVGVYVPACEWRLLRQLLSAASAYVQARTAQMVARIALEDASFGLGRSDDGRYRRQSFASGGSSPSDLRTAERVLSTRPASKAQRVYLRKLLVRLNRADEVIPELTMREAAQRIEQAKIDPDGRMSR